MTSDWLMQKKVSFWIPSFKGTSCTRSIRKKTFCPLNVINNTLSSTKIQWLRLITQANLLLTPERIPIPFVTLSWSGNWKANTWLVSLPFAKIVLKPRVKILTRYCRSLSYVAHATRETEKYTCKRLVPIWVWSMRFTKSFMTLKRMQKTR